LNAPYHNKALPEGALLREWRLEKVLGVGGFGIVYRGRGLYFDELVAIKEYFPGSISDRIDSTTVAPNDSSSEEVYNLGLSKFVEEAKILWNLSRPERHPNIVSVRSLFQINGTAYMVMDFESGVSLSQMLKDGRKLTEAELLAIIKPIAHGLDRAHRAGVLHRDIKPANILASEEGRPVLIDFGSARFESNQATSTKVTFYTPPYAAIEQYVKTYPQGPWTDIYALGVTLYECAAGKKPPEVLERLHGDHDEPLSETVRPGFSPAFVRAVEAAMAIKPADRPQSVSQWLRMFEAEDAPVNDEATRIAVIRDAPPAPPRAEPPPPAAAKPAEPPPVKAPEAKPVRPEAEPPVAPAGSAEAEPAKRNRAPIILAGVAVAILLGGIGAFVLKPGGGAPATAPGVADTAIAPEGEAQTAAVAPAGNVASGPAPGVVVASLEALVAEAKQAGRPFREVAALNGAGDKMSALLNVTPVDSAQIDQVAIQAAKAEGQTLARDAATQVRGLQNNPAWTGARAKGRAKGGAAAARQAKGALDAAVAAIGRAPDATSAVDAARQALANHRAFTLALAAAQPEFAGALRAQITAQLSGARLAAAEVARLAGGRKPGMLASSSSKRAYKLAQDNASRAHAKLAELEGQAQAAQAVSDLASLETTLATVTAGTRELEALRAAAVQGGKSSGSTEASEP
jgi:non-specific serine/threonine protein kinase